MTVRPAADRQGEADAWRSLDLVLAWLSELVGFSVASVNVVRGDQLEVIALSGVDQGVTMDGTVQQADQMLGTTWPVEELLTTLDLAEDWGRFKFIPHERAADSGPSGWLVKTPVPREGPDAWHVEDALVAPLYDEEGTLIGCLSVDDPRDGRRPPASMHHLLDEYAEHVNLGLLNALQRSRLADRARILDETRALIRQLTETPEADLDATHDSILQAFDADAVLIHIFGLDDAESSVVIPAHAGYAVETAMLDHRARMAWDRHTAYAAPAEEFLATLEAGRERDTAAAWMQANGIDTMLFAPLGAGTECLGSIVISRRPGRAAWTEQHLEAARELGQDLGRVLHARRVLQREQQLVAAQRDLDNAKSQLIAAVSRELTPPLDAISSLSQRLDPAELDRSTLAALYRESHRVSRVIDDLLLLSRLSDPDASAPSGTVDLVAVAQHTIAVVEAAQGFDVALRLQQSNRAVLVRGSAGELERALVRLVTYATLMQAPADAPVLVQVRERGATAEVVVGAGGDLTSARPLRERLLADSAGGELALAIADSAVRRHGGHLGIAEGPRGVSFLVSLPLA